MKFVHLRGTESAFKPAIERARVFAFAKARSLVQQKPAMLVSSLQTLPHTLILGLALSASAVTLCAQPQVLTLERALTGVEDVNLAALTSRENVLQSQQTVRTARAVVLPAVDLRATQFRRDPGASSVVNEFDAGLFGSMPLLDLRAFDSLRAVKKAVEVSQYRYELAVQQVLAAVAGSYFEHVRDIAFAKVIDANIERARVLLELANNRLRAGVATQIDVTRAEAELLTSEQARLQQQTVIVASELSLKRLLNLDLDAALELQAFDLRLDLEQGVRQMPIGAVLEHRADYQAAVADIDRLRLVRRASGRERLPTVDAVAQGGVTSETPLDGRDESFWSAGLQLNMPVFEGNRIDAELRRTDSQIRQADYARQDLELEIGSEFRIALQDVESQLAQIAVAEKNLALAAEELRLARVRYEQGVADNRELIEAENRFASSSFNVVNSRYSYHVARVELARVRGDVRIILSEGSVGGPAATTPAPSGP